MTSRTRTSHGVEVDLDRRHRRGPAVGRIGVADVRRVVEDDARVRLELLVDPGGAVRDARRRGMPRGTARRRCAPRPSALSRRAARITSPPTTMTVRLATVGPLNRAPPRCPAARTRPSRPARRARAATICGKTVLVPWPISVFAVSTRIRPSAVSSTEATEARYTSPEPVKPAPCHAEREPDAGRASADRRSGAGPPGSCPSPRRSDASLRGPLADALEVARADAPARAPPRRRRSRAGPGRSGSCR